MTACAGQLELEIDDDDDDDGDENDAVEYRATLFNAIDVTGIHLHLQGNSSNGLFGEQPLMPATMLLRLLFGLFAGI